MPTDLTNPPEAPTNTPAGTDIGGKHRAKRAGGGDGRPDPRTDNPGPDDGTEPPLEKSIEERRAAFKKLHETKNAPRSARDEARERRKAVGDDDDEAAPEADEEEVDDEDEEAEDAAEEADDEEDADDERDSEDEDDEESEEDDEDDEHRGRKPAAERREATRQSREEQESNRLNKAHRLLQREKVSPAVLSQMSKKAILEMSRVVREQVRAREAAKMELAQHRAKATSHDAESDTGKPDADSSPFDDLANAFDPKDGWDEKTISVMRDHSKRLNVAFKKATSTLERRLEGLVTAMNQQFSDGMRQQMRVRYPQLAKDKVAAKFERKVERALATGDYDEYRTIPAKIRAAAHDVAGTMFPSGKKPPVTHHAARNGGLETRSREAGKREGPLARRREAYKLVNSGVPPLEARRIAGVED